MSMVLPLTQMIDVISAYNAAYDLSPHVHLHTGVSSVDELTTLAQMTAAEVSASWYSSQAITMGSAFKNADGSVSTISPSVQWTYPATATDASISVSGYFVTGIVSSTTILLGAEVLAPQVMSGPDSACFAAPKLTLQQINE